MLPSSSLIYFRLVAQRDFFSQRRHEDWKYASTRMMFARALGVPLNYPPPARSSPPAIVSASQSPRYSFRVVAYYTHWYCELLLWATRILFSCGFHNKSEQIIQYYKRYCMSSHHITIDEVVMPNFRCLIYRYVKLCLSFQRPSAL